MNPQVQKVVDRVRRKPVSTTSTSILTGEIENASPCEEVSGSPILPPEVLLKIWVYLLPEPCFITTKWQRETGKWLDRARNRIRDALPYRPYPKYYRLNQPIPTVLQICRASRYEFLHQQNSPKGHPTYQRCSMGGGRWIYVDPVSDVVVLDNCRWSLTGLSNTVRHIGLRVRFKAEVVPQQPTGASVHLSPSFACDMNALKGLTCLQSLTFVIPTMKACLTDKQAKICFPKFEWDISDSDRQQMVSMFRAAIERCAIDAGWEIPETKIKSSSQILDGA